MQKMAKSKKNNWILGLLPGHKPDFIIIGAQKSGTSSLHYLLQQHPGLRGSTPKEIHFFDKWVNYGHDLRWYESHFKSGIFQRKIFFESSPNYIYHEAAARRILDYKPNLKFILVLRNPADRAYSAWNMYRDFFEKGESHKLKSGTAPDRPSPVYEHFYKGRSYFPDFKEALAIELDIIEMGQAASIEPAILRRGLYANQLETYFKYFQKDQFLVIGFRELFDDTEATLNKAYKFIDVKPVEFGRIKVKSRNVRSYENTMSTPDRQFLIDFYQAENDRLFKILGYRLNW